MGARLVRPFPLSSVRGRLEDLSLLPWMPDLAKYKQCKTTILAH